MTHCLLELGISDVCKIEDTHKAKYAGLNELNTRSAQAIWERANAAVRKAKELGIETDWYSYYSNAKSTQEMYNKGYWLTMYIWQDMMELAQRNNDDAFKNQILKAYYSGNWNLITVK